MEMKSLTLDGKTYDSFPDKTAAKSVNGHFPDENGNVDIETNAPTDEQVAAAVGNYLAEHPEATTTVQDKSITEAKLSDSVIKRIDGTAVFFGKTASFHGDSLTEPNFHYTKGYYAWVKELLGLASYNNYGVSGYKVSDVYNKVVSVDDTADIIFVMCGVNDQAFSVPLGTLGDTSSGTTYGALDMLCAALKQKYPTKLVVFITPHYQTNYPHNEGVTSYEVSKAIKEVCEKYSIPVYDNFVLSGIYSTNLSTLTTDNCHWNDTAHEMVGKNLSRYMVNTFGYLHSNTPGGDTPDVPEVTLSSISATYSGGSVEVGTDVNDLIGIAVTAHYTDGTSEVVTGYTLSGTIAESENVITVSYGGKTTTFIVYGVADTTRTVRINAKDYTIVEGKWINSNGDEGEADGYGITEFIAINPSGNTMTVSSNMEIPIAFYDSNNMFLGIPILAGAGLTNWVTGEITIPTGSAYCVFNVLTEFKDQYWCEYKTND